MRWWRKRDARRTFLTEIQAFTDAIQVGFQFRHLETYLHQADLQRYIRLMAAHYHFDHIKTELLVLAATLHDLGKLTILDTLVATQHQRLLPNSPEMAIIRQHTLYGERMLDMFLARLSGEAADKELLLEVVRHHHERWDGRGYPDGLVGDAIAVEVRIISIVDAISSMASPKWDMRTPMTTAQIICELRHFAGTQFAPVCAAIAADMLESGGLLLTNPIGNLDDNAD